MGERLMSNEVRCPKLPERDHYGRPRRWPDGNIIFKKVNQDVECLGCGDNVKIFSDGEARGCDLKNPYLRGGEH